MMTILPVMSRRGLRGARLFASTHKAAMSSTPSGAAQLYVAGKGGSGQIGNGAKADSNSFVHVALEGMGVRAAACGASHTLAVTDDGTLWSWGEGKSGQLGHGNRDPLTEPHPVKALEGVDIVQVVCGESHSAALSSHGHVYTFGYGGGDAWGYLRGPGALGHGSRKDRLVPTPVEAIVDYDISRVFSGKAHMLCVAKTGEVFSWGNGEYGRLGVGDSSSRLAPHLMRKDACGWAFACGSSHSACIDDEGTLMTWGQNEKGQCGRTGGDVFSMDSYPTPVYLSEVTEARSTKVACGPSHTAVLTESNECIIFGGKRYFNPFNHSSISEYKPVSIACGSMSVICTTVDGKLIVFGSNKNGQLGTGDTQDKWEPEEISSFEGRVESLACGATHTALIASPESA